MKKKKGKVREAWLRLFYVLGNEGGSRCTRDRAAFTIKPKLENIAGRFGLSEDLRGVCIEKHVWSADCRNTAVGLAFSC